jgi:hypothetical protein
MTRIADIWFFGTPPQMRVALYASLGILLETARAPGHLTFGLRSSWERAEFMLAFVMMWAPLSTLVGTCSPFDVFRRAKLTP